MSEFSDSYFLRPADANDALSLMNRSGIEGFIGEEAGEGWVLILPKSEYELCENLIKNNIGVLLHYQYAEDHGFAFNLYKGNKAVSEYLNSWDDEVECDYKNLNFDNLVSTLELSYEKIYKLKNLFKAIDKESQNKEYIEYFKKSAYIMNQKFMETLGIRPEAYSWVSYHYAALEDEGIEIKLKKIKI